MKQKILILLCILIGGLASCSHSEKNRQIKEEKARADSLSALIEQELAASLKEIEDQEPEGKQIHNYYGREGKLEDISSTIGIVKVLFYDYMEQLKDEKISILNQDGSLWALANFYEGRYEGEEDFMPRIVKTGYGIILFDCVSETDSSYTIIVNEETRQSKILPKKEVTTQHPSLAIIRCLHNCIEW